jgi:hypothetical protein
MDILFSYRKGWLLYSPFAAFGLAGIFFADGMKAKINLLIFWSLLIYISSCWWCWTYSPSSFGQRPFIDYYALIALQAAFFFQYLQRNKWKVVAPAALLLLVPFNLLQTYQYRKGIIPGEFGSSETYWDNLFAIRPVAYYPIPPQTIIDRKEVVDDFEAPARLSSPWIRESHSRTPNGFVT